MFSVPSAQASTTVTGDNDRTSPLVIEPSGTGTVHNASNMVMFIQRMPVTKTVNRITLGDIGLDPGCTYTGPVLRLFIRQHPTGQIGTETSSLYWEGNALEEIAADTDLEPRTWRTEPITFVKGRGYSFWVQGTINGCNSYKLRSWPHNHPQVNTGQERCDRVLGSSFRMWHEAGQSDAVPCPYDLVPGNFDSGMPEGWLSVTQSWGSSYVETKEFYEQGAEPPQPTCPYPLGEYGGIAQRWRSALWSSNWGEYVCLWDQRYPDWVSPSSPFYPNDPDDGWYYGPGWMNPAADWPRDMYLKLDLDEDELAAWYKPNLYFDSSEKWRPLDIDQFFDERDDTGGFLHQLCYPLPGGPGPPPRVCGPIGSPGELMENNVSDAELKINGDTAEGDDDYQSPNEACTTDGLYDCNGGSISTLYDYVSQPLADSEYRYIGYWAFYRFNDFAELVSGDHEGDWEGLALAPSYDRPGTFDFASFSSHGPWYSYLRDTLSCADAVFSPYTCGSEEDKYFSHVRTYVANGTHANYPASCANSCGRGSGIVPETDYDGQRGWGHNFNYQGLHPSGTRAFPAADGTHWVNWMGEWGVGGSPTSPGQQQQFLDPWTACGWGQECPQPDAARNRDSGGRQASRASLPATPPNRCRRWFGPMVVAVACDAAGLRRTIRAGRIGRDGTLRLQIRRRAAIAARREPGLAASSRALAQVVGQPLTVGDSLLVRKASSSRVALLVRFRSRERLYEARFTPRQVQGTRLRVHIQAAEGQPSLSLVSRGHSPSRPQAVRLVSR